jgi:hypothetical protein
LSVLTGVDAVAAPALAAHDPSDPAWGCYDPEPSHPTGTEMVAFFDQISAFAKAAEKQHGVPAAGIAAMSMLESGYGFTRTAQFANNPFGWKVSDTDAAAYVLTCQPASDPGNHYRKFTDRGSAVDAVAGRLGLHGKPEYAKVTEVYAAERAGAVPVAEAVAHWVRGIQRAGYNPSARYPDHVLAIANNYRSPGTTVSSEFNLYVLSEIAPPASNAVAAPAPSRATLSVQDATLLQRQKAAEIAARFARGGRYIAGVDTSARPHENCTAVATGDALLTNLLVAPDSRLAGSNNAVILDCTHRYQGRQDWALIVAATATTSPPELSTLAPR